MAALQDRNGHYRILFRHHGKQITLPVGKVSKAEAEAFLGKVEYLLLRIKQGLIHVPPGVALADFIVADGKPRPAVAPAQEAVTFDGFRRRYLAAHSGGAMEANSLATAAMHLGHFARTLGDKFPLAGLTLPDLQRHVDERRRKTYRGKPLSPVTLRKEMASFRAAWNWATVTGLVTAAFPSRGLVYPKGDEKPPFMTRAEIERKLPGLTRAEADELWECLYLRKEEIDEMLAHVRDSATHPWVFPMVATAAYTGARRSELLRAEAADVDLAGETILIREKKRSKKQRTTRRVSLPSELGRVLGEWLDRHPGGKYLFCQTGVVARSKNRSTTTGHRSKGRATSLTGRMATVKSRDPAAPAAVTRDEAHDHLKRTLSGSKWEVLRGWHVLRHSYVSALAAAGVDQRIIDEFVGHSQEEQKRRYRHLIPDLKQKAVTGVFG